MEQTITRDLTVDEVLTRSKQTVSVFVRLRMACAGCPMAPFETLESVAQVYDMPVDLLIDELEQAIPKDQGERT